jgi:uncharacterized membrane protein YkvA (DUF1232 family)
MEEKEMYKFTEDSFRKKLSKKLVKSCRKLAEVSLTMFFCMKDIDTPLWAKTTIASALGYLIWPADLIPDAIPLAGLTDDAGALALAFATVVSSIKPEHREQAKQVIQSILGEKTREQPGT